MAKVIAPKSIIASHIKTPNAIACSVTFLHLCSQCYLRNHYALEPEMQIYHQEELR